MPARFEPYFRTLSRRPFWHAQAPRWLPKVLRRAKWFVEGDRFAYHIVVRNDGTTIWPPEEMRVSAKWSFPENVPEHTTPLLIPPGRLQPGEFIATKEATVEVMAPGFSWMTVDYDPFDEVDCHLLDVNGHVILPGSGRVIANFRGFSTVEIETIYALFIATAAALASGVALALTIYALFFR